MKQQINEIRRMQQLAGIIETSLIQEGLKGKFHKDDNTYTYDHLIGTDSPSKEQLQKVKDAIKADKEELTKKGKKVKQVSDGTVPYLELINA